MSTEIAPNHFQELHQGSNIDPEIIALNFKSLTGVAPYEYLCSSERLKRTNPGRLEKWVIDLLAHTESGGWWGSGLDPLNNWKPMLWGCFKPDHPRQAKPEAPHQPGKLIKYEHPLKTPTRAFFLAVPDRIWEQVAGRYGIPIPAEDRELGFWHWVESHCVPILITEGAKKAAALLSAGYAAIALPGISSGYRAKETSDPASPKGARERASQQGNLIKRHLISDLQIFATRGREVLFGFDHETKPKTVEAVRLNLGITGSLFKTAGCRVQVIALPGPEKGVDDFLVARGPEALEQVYQRALPFEHWQAAELHALTYPPNQVVNQRYLGEVPLPQSGLALIRSAMGTGKTTALSPHILAAVRSGRRVLVIGHRIQLVRALCAVLGINYIEEVRRSQTGTLLGYGLCIDSLHPNSQAQLNPQDWQGAIVILDEAEQVLWHALNSSTCYRNRVAILKTLKELLNTVLRTGGLVVAQDAHLSDLSVDFLKAASGVELEPWLLVNEWKPPIGWDVYSYNTPNAAPLVARATEMIAAGVPVYICVDSQKSKSRWGSKNLESYFQQKFPNQRILRIDSESVADPSHPASGIIEHLNAEIPEYDIVIATPSLGTGVSIDVRTHFGAVFGIFTGAIPGPEVRQALSRVRESVPRYVWANRFGLKKIGHGSLNYREIVRCSKKVVKQTVALLKNIDFDLDEAHDPISLRTWAKMAARVNASMQNYREALRWGLIEEGHQVTLIGDGDDPDPNSSRQVKEVLSAVRDQNQQAEALAVEQALDLTETEYEVLKDKRAKTLAERNQQRKHELQNRYGVPVTVDLKLKDDAGWYPQLRLHYYLTQNSQAVRERDQRHLEGHLERGEGRVAPQDVRLYTAQVEVLKFLGIMTFMVPGRELRQTDPDVQHFCELAKPYCRDIKMLFGFHIHPDATPIQVLGMFLTKLGIKLKYVKRELQADGSRCRVYQFGEPDDGRETVFAAWEQKEADLSCPDPDIHKQIIAGRGSSGDAAA